MARIKIENPSSPSTNPDTAAAHEEIGVEQHVAQATNLIAFLPMAAFTLNVHKKNGLLKTQGLLSIVIPAVLGSVTAGFAAALLPPVILKKLFGAFLVLLAAGLLAKVKFSFSKAAS